MKHEWSWSRLQWLTLVIHLLQWALCRAALYPAVTKVGQRRNLSVRGRDRLLKANFAGAPHLFSLSGSCFMVRPALPAPSVSETGNFSHNVKGRCSSGFPWEGRLVAVGLMKPVCQWGGGTWWAAILLFAVIHLCFWVMSCRIASIISQECFRRSWRRCSSFLLSSRQQLGKHTAIVV